MTLFGAGSAPAQAQTADAGAVAGRRRNARPRCATDDALSLSGRVAAACHRPPRVRPARRRRGAAWARRSPQSGSYSFRLRPARSGAFRAVCPEGVSSTSERDRRRAPRRPRQPARPDRARRCACAAGSRPGSAAAACGSSWPPGTAGAPSTAPSRAAAAATAPSGRASGSGRYRLRVKFAGDRRNSAVSRTLRGRVFVYRPSSASWYGPGLYGNATACGGTLARARSAWRTSGCRAAPRSRSATTAARSPSR